MTDRERLLEQIREAEKRAADASYHARHWMRDQEWDGASTPAASSAREAAHHALTAMALRRLIALADDLELDWTTD